AAIGSHSDRPSGLHVQIRSRQNAIPEHISTRVCSHHPQTVVSAARYFYPPDRSDRAVAGTRHSQDRADIDTVVLLFPQHLAENIKPHEPWPALTRTDNPP